MNSLRTCSWLVLVSALSLSATAGAAEPPLSFLMPDDFEDLDLVAWRVEQATPDPRNPLLEPKMPWDQGSLFGHGTLLHDPIDGKWKAWNISEPNAKPDGRPGTWTNDRRLTYLESDDGVNWRRPELSEAKWPGYEHTNILIDPWCSYASVNIDPKREYPYEMFMFFIPEYEPAVPPDAAASAPARARRPGSPGRGLFRFKSKNGTRWEVAAGPIELETSDSCFIFRQGDAYVAYHKTELPAFPGGLAPYDIADGGLRVIGRRTSADGLHWSDPPKIILTPDWRDPADTQFMELNPVEFPGGYIAVAVVYHNHTQNIDLQLAASRDGIHWWRPDRRPALPNLPLGEYGGGMIWPLRSPVVDGEKVHIYYAGAQGLHGDLFNTKGAGPRKLMANGQAINRLSTSLPDNAAALCRATWSANRLWAIAPAAGGLHVGQAVTKRRAMGGSELAVNVMTHARGEMRVELLDEKGQVVPGFGAADCQPIQGDHARINVRWTGGSVAPAAAVKVRFLLHEAYLYGFDMPAAPQR